MSGESKQKGIRNGTEQAEAGPVEAGQGHKVLEAFGITNETVLDFINDGFYILSREGHFLYVNPIIEKRSGIPIQEVVGRHFLDIVSEKDGERVKNNFEKVMKGEDVPPYELEYMRADGTPMTVEVSTKPVFQGGRVAGLLGLSRDVTARRRMEEALRESEARLRTAVESLPFDFFIIDEEGRYIMQNATCRKRYGNLLGKRPEDLDVDGDTLRLWQKNNQRAFGGEVIKEEVSFHTEGEQGFYYNVISPIQGEDQIRSILGINIDITERVKAEEALREARDELEQRVQERTAQLSKANEELRDEVMDRKRAQEALKERELALEMKTKELEEVNSALRILLRRRDKDKAELEEKVLANVKELVQPYVEKLKKSSLDQKQVTYANILESNLNDIISPFVHQLSSKYSILTPTEIQIAQLIKEGKTTKEIAELMGSSKRTVESHRENIRVKLGLKNRKINLRSYLSSL